MRTLVAWMLTVILLGLVPSVSHAGGSKKEPTDADHREAAIEWAMGFMIRHAPPGRKTHYIDAQETKEEALKRYRSIAEDLVEVVYDPNTAPVFPGLSGRSRTLSVILGIALHESGFGKHVDKNIGPYARGDQGNSWCLMQMNVGKGRAWKNAGGWNIKEDRPWKFGDKAEDIVQGASGPEMVQDRRKCFTEALRLIKVSFRACKRNTFYHRLNVYASGSCKYGSKGSAKRMRAATKFWDSSEEQREGFEDPVVVSWVQQELERREKAAKGGSDKSARGKPSD